MKFVTVSSQQWMDTIMLANNLSLIKKNPHIFNWSLLQETSDLFFQCTLAKEVFLVLNNPLSLTNNSFTTTTEFLFFNL